MIWVAYRQHRAETIAVGAVLAVLGVVLLWSGLVIGAAYRDEGINACLVTHAAACDGGIRVFSDAFQGIADLMGWLNFLPAFVGAFIGAPLLAREIERGTFRLAWTQGVTRWRWLAIELGVVLLVSAVAGAALTLMMSQWRAPFNAISGRLDPLGFDFQGVTPVAYFVLAASLAVFLGVVIKRTLPAMAATLAVFIPFRLFTDFWLRAHYAAPVVKRFDVFSPAAAAPAGSWVLSDVSVDRAGNVLSTSQLDVICPLSANTTKQLLTACAHRNGIMEQLSFHTADRFWSFQAIEFGIYVALAVACLGLAFWWLRRRFG